VSERVKHIVLYRSGQTLEFYASNVVVSKRGSAITAVEWPGDIHPRPLHLGIDDIVAIWVDEGDTK
jgi:hypothetical protein